MFTVDQNKKVKKKTVEGPGFSLKIPKDFASHSENDPKGQWGYGEFFQTNTLEENLNPQTNLFFYYWENTNSKLSEKQAQELIETVCSQRVFSSEHSLELIEMFPITFKRFPAFILKYRFSHYDPEASGNANFFLINNTQQDKTYVLGTLIQAIGSRMIENEAMAWIEDQVIPSFRFKKTIDG
jgi:hypothetical protein